MTWYGHCQTEYGKHRIGICIAYFERSTSPSGLLTGAKEILRIVVGKEWRV